MFLSVCVRAAVGGRGHHDYKMKIPFVTILSAGLEINICNMRGRREKERKISINFDQIQTGLYDLTNGVCLGLVLFAFSQCILMKPTASPRAIRDLCIR